MKKLNKNSLVFCFAVLFVICGYFGNMIRPLFSTVTEAGMDIKRGKIDEALELRKNFDKITGENLLYRDLLMDINSGKENILGTRLIQKDDEVIVKADNDSLKSPENEIVDESEFDRMISEITKLEKVTKTNGGQFLYCAVPTKEYYSASLPPNASATQGENYARLIEGLRESDTPFVDMSEVFKAADICESDIYFETDHHWVPKSGFMAYKTICETLNSRYRFEYNEEYTSIDNYNIKTYPDWFLGSYGKKVGTYFSWSGADDFDLITPKFETRLTEEQPFKNEVREGGFEDTVLFLDNMKKDYYNVDTYSTYSGGNIRLQIIKNQLNKDGDKILMIRDSSGQVVSPFLSLQAAELHVCDVRSGERYVGEKLDMQEYIEAIKPDYVIVMYSGIAALKDDTFF